MNNNDLYVYLYIYIIYIYREREIRSERMSVREISEKKKKIVVSNQ